MAQLTAETLTPTGIYLYKNNYSLSEAQLTAERLAPTGIYLYKSNCVSEAQLTAEILAPTRIDLHKNNYSLCEVQLTAERLAPTGIRITIVSVRPSSQQRDWLLEVYTYIRMTTSQCGPAHFRETGSYSNILI